ncbi:hypothetical protein K440DRAFT_614476 [Wilcoxina mikolae CBS 423.85]|nr:hypothetical protein K440DRAFT_614476 [Wilcoxina mikolae CBS 423.85]
MSPASCHYRCSPRGSFTELPRDVRLFNYPGTMASGHPVSDTLAESNAWILSAPLLDAKRLTAISEIQ